MFFLLFLLLAMSTATVATSSPYFRGSTLIDAEAGQLISSWINGANGEASDLVWARCYSKLDRYGDFTSGWSPSGINNPGNAFDGDYDTVAGANGGSFGPFTYTFNPAIEGVTSARMLINLGASTGQVGSTENTFKAGGTDVTAKAKAADAYSTLGLKWIDVTSEVGNTWNTFQITGVGGSTNPNVAAIEVNGRTFIHRTPVGGGDPHWNAAAN